MRFFLVSDDSTLSKHINLHNNIESICPGELLQLGLKSMNESAGIIILCELSLNNNNESVPRSQLFGIDFGRNLRQLGVKVPFLFVSFLSLEKIIEISRFGSLIKAIGHEFLHLPANNEDVLLQFKSVKSLTDTELKDVQLFSCEPEGIVRTKTHQIPSLIERFKQTALDGVMAADELRAWIIDMHKAYNKNAQNVLVDFKKQFAIITDENIYNACEFVKEAGEKLLQSYKPLSGVGFNEPCEKKPWSLLMLDDELNKDSEIVKLIEKKGVEVICTTNPEDAFHALHNDDELRGKIPLVLCDYRLFETRAGIPEFYQKIQGYTFLQEIGERFQSRLISAVVYSGLPRQFLMETFKTFKIRTEIYSKIDFGSDNPRALDYLSARIIELGDANYEAMLSLPLSNAGWASHLHKWYMEFRKNKNYEALEREISDFCNEWIHDFHKGNSPDSPMGKGEQIPQDDKDPEKKLERFISIFKTRRIAQFLYFYFEYQNRIKGTNENLMDQVFNVIKPASRKSDSLASRKRFLSVILGLSLSEFPFGATIEELNWFHYDREVEVLDSYKVYRKKLNQTEGLIKDLIDENFFLKPLIVESGYRIKPEESPGNLKESTSEVLFNSTNFSPYFFNKKDFGTIMEWLSDQFEKRTSVEINSFLKMCKKIDDVWKWRINQ